MTTTDIEALEQHLLYHKALAESPEEVERINGYLTTLNSAVDGTKLADPVDEAIRRMFVMVLENGIDPWAIDLEFFVETYSKKVAEDNFDILVAGKFIYWAWRILGMQVNKSMDTFNPPVDEFEGCDEDFFTEEEDSGIIIPDLPVHDVDYSRVIERSNYAKPTLFDLILSLEDAQKEVEIREARQEVLEKLRAERAANRPKFDNKAHEEDDETVVKRVYKTIIERTSTGTVPIILSKLYNGNLKDSISFFVSVLHLVRYGLLDIEQESLPRGDITISVIDPTAEVPLSTEA